MSKITDIINKYTAGEATLEETNAALAELGGKMDLSIRIQREEIFDAMHRI